MSKRIAIQAIALLLGVASVQAASYEQAQIATDLGMLLASEEYCGLRFDQKAVRTFVDEKVPAGDMTFVSDLAANVDVSKFKLETFDASHKAAHCEQIERSAKHYGFVRP